MAQDDNSRSGQSQTGLTRADAIGVLLAGGWIVMIGLLYWFSPISAVPLDGFQIVLIIIAIVMPIALILVAVTAARVSRNVRAESQRMKRAVERLHQTYVAEQGAVAEALAFYQDQAEQINALLAAQQSAQTEPEGVSDAMFIRDPESEPGPESGPESGPEPESEPEPEPAQEPAPEIAPAPRPTPEAAEEISTRFASRREVSRLIVPQSAPQVPDDQPSLALDTASQDKRPALTRAEMIRALHFPNDENDAEGFEALRRALRDRDARKLVQASQDVLTLLSQDGIYMDDLQTEPVGAEIWRRFTHGERGPSVARLGTVRDGDTLDVTIARMRDDTIFRDAVHHFLRRFDQMLISFEEEATDTDILAMAETRTARAFVLLGRATGMFR